MGFFQGVAKAYGEISSEKREERLLKDEREARKAERVQNLEDQKTLASYTSQLGVKASLLTQRLSSGGGRSGGSSAKPEEIANALGSLTTLGLSEKSLQKIQSAGNASGIITANNLIIDAYSKMKDNNVPPNQIAEILNAEIDSWNVEEESIDTIEFAGESFEVTSPGGVGSLPIYVDEGVKVNEVEMVEKRILSENERMLENEKKRLQTAMSTLTELERKGELTAWASYLPDVTESISKRLIELDEIKSSYEGGNIPALVGLYGKGPVEKIAQAFKVPTFQLNSVFTDEGVPDSVEPWSFTSDDEGHTKRVNAILRKVGAIK